MIRREMTVVYTLLETPKYWQGDYLRLCGGLY